MTQNVDRLVDHLFCHKAGEMIAILTRHVGARHLSLVEDVVQEALVNIVLRTGEGSANDGLVMDEKGRVYIASNKAGKIWRYDPKTKETVLIMQGVVGIASMAFGAGAWDATSIYATSTFNPDHAKRVWRIPVGVKGAKIYYGNE